MVTPSHTPEAERQTGWFPSWRALWSLCWRLWIMLVFFVGSFCCFFLELWWAALGCIIGFVIAAFVIRRVSTVERQTSSEDSIVFL
jgi:TRAP-type C4-dicarboxylate transport system permease large subunit